MAKLPGLSSAVEAAKGALVKERDLKTGSAKADDLRLTMLHKLVKEAGTVLVKVTGAVKSEVDNYQVNLTLMNNLEDQYGFQKPKKPSDGAKTAETAETVAKSGTEGTQ